VALVFHANRYHQHVVISGRRGTSGVGADLPCPAGRSINQSPGGPPGYFSQAAETFRCRNVSRGGRRSSVLCQEDECTCTQPSKRHKGRIPSHSRATDRRGPVQNFPNQTWAWAAHGNERSEEEAERAIRPPLASKTSGPSPIRFCGRGRLYVRYVCVRRGAPPRSPVPAHRAVHGPWGVVVIVSSIQSILRFLLG
jgi:hypothetical protein